MKLFNDILTLDELVKIKDRKLLYKYIVPASESDSDTNKYFAELIRKYGFKGTLPVFFNPLFRRCSNIKNKFYFLTIKHGNDEILIPLYDPKMYPAFYFIIFYYPISFLGDKNIEDKILNILLKNKLVGNVYFNETFLNRFKNFNFIKKDNHVEYYISVKEKFAIINKSKFRSRYGINKLLKDEKFIFRKYKKSDFFEVKDFLNSWITFKKQKNMGIHDLKGYLNMLYLLNKTNDNSAFGLLYYYNNILCAVNIGLSMFGNKKNYYFALTKNIVNTVNFNEKNLPKNFKNRISKHMLYLTISYCMNNNIDIINNGNCGDATYLKKHKKDENSDYIQYYQLRR